MLTSRTRTLGNRFYNYYLPTKNDKRSLVLVFHGASSDPKAVEWESGFTDYAQANNFAVAYPGGTNDRIFIKNKYLYWNDGRPWSDGSYSTVDDVGFVEKVIKDLSTLTSINPLRIYSVGYSNGAHFCCRLAQQLSHKIKAIGCVASARKPDLIFPAPPRKISAMFMAGMADPIVPFEGGPSKVQGFATPADPWLEVVEAWREFNDCLITETRNVGKSVSNEGLTREPNSSVRFRSVYSTDGGHTWPGGKAESLFLGRVNRDFVAAQEFWSFFNS
jgi:polyhydroxybutyrate depolymerase